MPSLPLRNGGLRHRIRERLRLGRTHGTQHAQDSEDRPEPTPRTVAEPSVIAANIEAVSRNAELSVTGLNLEDQGVATADDNEAAADASSDVWSAAYREAVRSLGAEVNVAIFQGENVAQLFRQLGEMDRASTQDSAFLRGVKYLRSLQVPLENLKLALDLAAPLSQLEPTAATVVGVVRSVTAIAISVSTADIAFAKQIGEMLEQIAYIDDCDTLGQKSNKPDIYKALVSVYRKLLEFYNAAFEILTKKGAKLVMSMVLEHDRLPKVVDDFLKQADNLRRLVQKATWEIVEDIRTMLYDHEIVRWLDSNKISRQTQQHAALRALCADEACAPLLADAAFVRWYGNGDVCYDDDTSYSAPRQLAVLGDMGHGKTVSMAFLIDELGRRSARQLPQPKLCYYYCRDADASGGRNDQLFDIFATLVLSLLVQLSGLKRVFFDWYRQTQTAGVLDPAKNVQTLEAFLHETVAALDRPLFLVVDGLDECERHSRNMLLRSLDTLLQKTPRLKVLVSARPEEEIVSRLHASTTTTAVLHLGANAQRDRIIVERWVANKLDDLDDHVQALVVDRLASLARGSGIWTQMVVQLIHVRRIRARAPMQTFLDHIPQPAQLDELYVSLFARYTANDPENEAMAAAALDILAVARRPLSVLELAWAAAVAVAPPESTRSVTNVAQRVDHQRLLGLIQPFLARVDFADTARRQVRLVHKSASDFVLRGGARGLSPFSLLPVEQRTAQLETALLDVCVRYLLLDDMDRLHLFSDEQIAIEALPQNADLFSESDEPIHYDPHVSWEVWELDMVRYDPIERGFGELFVYAACHWTDHFGAAGAATDTLPLHRVETLCHAGSRRLQNWIMQNCRPGCTIQPQFVFDSSLYDPLSIAALYGSDAALRRMLDETNFDSSAFLADTALQAADQIFQWGDWARIATLFHCSSTRIGPPLHSLDFFQLAMRHWFGSVRPRPQHEWIPVFGLVDGAVEDMVANGWGNELLCLAAARRCMPLVQRLMHAADSNTALRAELLRAPLRTSHSAFRDKQAHQSVGEAVLGGHMDIVAFLLEQPGIDAHLHHRNARGESVLVLAARHSNLVMLQLLVKHFNDGCNQLSNEELQQCLHIAEERGDLDMCSRLLGTEV